VIFIVPAVIVAYRQRRSKTWSQLQQDRYDLGRVFCDCATSFLRF